MSARRDYPRTRTDDVKETIHGVEITDPYRWLEDGESLETKEWIKSQNEYTQALIGTLPGREGLMQRVSELMRIDWLNIPLVRGGRFFFHKQLAAQELSIVCMRRELKCVDEVLIDPHPMSPDYTTSVTMWEVSDDGTVMAYAVKEGGQDETTVNLLDVDRLEVLKDGLPKARYHGFSFKPDKSGFYYVRHRTDGDRVYYHAMGTELTDDIEVFGMGYGPDKIIGVNLSEDGRYLLISVWHGAAATKSEIYIQNVIEGGSILPVVNDIEATFYGHIGGDHLYLKTDWEAPNGRILRVDLRDPTRKNWLEIVPECHDAIEYFSLAGGKLLVNYLHNVTSRVKIFEPDGEHVRDIAFPAIGTVGGIAGRWKDDEVFYAFSSFHIPPTIYKHDMETGGEDVWWRAEVPIESEKFQVKQVWYKSKDGEVEVPMFIMHSRGIELDGSNPTLLTGYGGFRSCLTPWFSTEAALWVEAGGVFAQPNLRGGGEFGEGWHEAGMLDKKQNVFDDFITSAEWLITNGYTKPEKLAIAGGSNGGLLVGAALTQRPDLFRAVVCTYPLLDMVRYHKFLVAKFWISEYGSSEDPDQFRYIYAYSPYHRVRQRAGYPAVLFITGDLDTRVDPLHTRKMVALLQSATGSDNPVLLRYHTKAGHSGGLPLSKQIEEMTDEFSFLFWQLEMKT